MILKFDRNGRQAGFNKLRQFNIDLCLKDM